MFKPRVKLRAAYGRPWSKLIEESTVDRRFLTEVGKILVKQVVKEAKKDLAKQGYKRTPHKQPEGIPIDPKFYASFYYQVVGNSKVEIGSTWPWIKQIVEGRKKFRMEWLTRDRGVGIVPLEPTPGEILFRWAPQSKEQAWIHPGFDKHNFVDRAFKNAKAEISQKALQALKKALRSQRHASLK